MPRVTVLLATYNWAPVLPYSIGSALDQTFTDFELLVVGDGCTDESAEVVGGIGDPRVRWYNLPTNSGHQSAPNNEGMRLAAGDVIAYLGHDDLWLPYHLAALVDAIDGGASMAHGRVLRVVPGQAPQAWPWSSWRYTPKAWIPPTAVAHRRDVGLRVGGHRAPADVGTVEPEADLWWRICQATGRPVLVRRLTCIKLPAALREGVYRERPCHEQAEWLTRIRGWADPEAEVSALATEVRVPSWARRRERLRRPAHQMLIRLGLARPYVHTSALDRWQERRRFKGLED